jgi:hypothetical protein
MPHAATLAHSLKPILSAALAGSSRDQHGLVGLKLEQRRRDVPSADRHRSVTTSRSAYGTYAMDLVVGPRAALSHGASTLPGCSRAGTDARPGCPYAVRRVPITTAVLETNEQGSALGIVGRLC